MALGQEPDLSILEVSVTCLASNTLVIGWMVGFMDRWLADIEVFRKSSIALLGQ